MADTTEPQLASWLALRTQAYGRMHTKQQIHPDRFEAVMRNTLAKPTEEEIDYAARYLSV